MPTLHSLGERLGLEKSLSETHLEGIMLCFWDILGLQKFVQSFQLGSFVSREDALGDKSRWDFVVKKKVTELHRGWRAGVGGD